MTDRTAQLAALDHAHVWHPFTPMKQWRESPPVIIERADGAYLFDTEGRRYIDGVSSLWCNVHGHRVPEIDDAIRRQLDQVAHTTLLGLASPPSIELAARLAALAPAAVQGSLPVEPGGGPGPANQGQATSGGRRRALSKVFYSDAGATAVEAALKMAVGYWHHRGQPARNTFIALAQAYHGDTTGGMSIGFSDLFHRPFRSMVFATRWMPTPDPCRLPAPLQAAIGQGQTSEASPAPHGPAGPGDRRGEHVWPSEDPALAAALRDYCLAELEKLLQRHAHETAAIVVEPVVQGAAGMICQPPGFLRGVADLARRYDVLLIADEVATGFGRTGRMFACEHEGVCPDLLCLGKGISAGYLPLAATLASDEIEQAFCGELAEKRTFYHGHTYTGNPLACAAGLASLDLFQRNNLLEHIQASAAIIRDRLGALRDHPHVLDVRQRGIMVGIELCRQRPAPGRPAEPFDFSRRTGTALCLAMRPRGLVIRPLGDVLVLMPIPAMPHEVLHQMLDVVLETLRQWRFE